MNIRTELESFYQKNKIIFPILTAIFYGVGVFGHALEITLPWMDLLTPWVLFSGILLVLFTTPMDSKFYWWFFIGGVITFFLEAVGTATGLIFGEYNYTEVLGLSFMHVPIVIGFNWVIIVWGLETFISEKLPGFWSVFLTAAGAMVFDIFLEPVAIARRYWIWPDDIVPLQNYLAWFLIALFLAAFYRLLKLPKVNPYPFQYVLIQLGFFLLLDVLILVQIL